MILLTWLISIIAAFLLGYHSQRLTKKVEILEETIKTKIDRPKEEEPTSELIDLTDEVQNARYEQRRIMDDLNPK